MTPESFRWLIVLMILGAAALDTVSDLLNLKHSRTELPDEFKGVYDPEKYATSLRYQKDTHLAEIVRRAILTPLTLAFALLGGFNVIDLFARGLGQGPIVTGLVFAGVASVLSTIVRLPFSIYDTFVVEEKYGFNRTTPKTFAGDLLKGLVLTALLGAPIFAAILYFFETTGPRAWLYSWLAFTAIQLLIVFLAPVLLMPIFNKFNPLKEGELKKAIEDYARTENFQMQGVFTMDGSKRSSKANAFFTGFGRFRRLVLFDTLIEKQSVEELTAVVAHEIGHFKRGHILKSMVVSVALTGVMFWSLSLLIENPALFGAFKMEHVSIYASFIFVSFLYGPVLRLISVFNHLLSRKFEFEADAYAAETYRKPEQLVSALKKLSMDNLSNLTPHPLKVWLDYTHPPVLKRIAKLRSLRSAST